MKVLRIKAYYYYSVIIGILIITGTIGAGAIGIGAPRLAPFAKPWNPMVQVALCCIQTFAARLLKGAAIWNRIEGNWKHWTSCTARKVQERYDVSAKTLYASTASFSRRETLR